MKKSIVTLILASVLSVTTYYGFIFSLKAFLWLTTVDNSMIGLIIVIATIFYLALVEIKNFIEQ